MKDAIDKRNERERIARSIVKRRNIIYISQEELDRKKQEELEEQQRREREAAVRLVRQFKEESNKEQALEIECILADQEMLKRQLETGLDATGKKPMNDVTQERVEAILSEKNRRLQEIIATSFLGADQENKSVAVSLQEKNSADGPKAEEGNEKASVAVEETGAQNNESQMETDVEENIQEELSPEADAEENVQEEMNLDADALVEESEM